MSINFSIKPRKLITHLDKEEKENSVVLFDLDFHDADSKAVRCNINVIFKAIALTKGIIRKREFYIATRGSRISTRFQDGRVQDYTVPEKIEVNYTNVSSEKKSIGVKLSPKVKTKEGTAESELEIGEISSSKEKEKKYTSTYSTQETTLTPTNEVDSLHWDFNLPLGQKIVRDFIVGNLYLYVDYVWKQGRFNKTGTVSVRPTDILFFDSDRKALSGAKSLIIFCKLLKDGIKIYNKNGITVEVSL